MHACMPITSTTEHSCVTFILCLNGSLLPAENSVSSKISKSPISAHVRALRAEPIKLGNSSLRTQFTTYDCACVKLHLVSLATALATAPQGSSFEGSWWRQVIGLGRAVCVLLRSPPIPRFISAWGREAAVLQAGSMHAKAACIATVATASALHCTVSSSWPRQAAMASLLLPHELPSATAQTLQRSCAASAQPEYADAASGCWLPLSTGHTCKYKN
jgi:hypothetical protein